MALTTVQLALINNLTYTAGISPIPSIYEYEGMTIQDFITDYYAKKSAIKADGEYAVFRSGKEWEQILDAVSKDPDLCRMTIASKYNDTTMDDRGIVFTDSQSGEAVVAYRGTGSNEWVDNFYGGGPTDTRDGVSTAQQEKALSWYQEKYKELGLDQYDTVTVTGHSKGGNKAQYIAIEDNTVDRCVSFDGQGFSDDYVALNKDKIAANSYKISNHCAEGDYVNPLLNSVGLQRYYKQNMENSPDGFLENHCPNAYLHYDENGNSVMYKGTQSKEIQDIEKFLNSYLRTLSPEERKKTMTVVGDIVDKGIKHEFDGITGSELINDYLQDPKYNSVVIPLLAFLIRYQEDNPSTVESVKKILSDMGMGDAGKTVDFVTGLATNEIIQALFAVDYLANNKKTVKILLNKQLESAGITSEKDKEALIDLLFCVLVDRYGKYGWGTIPEGNDIRIEMLPPDSGSKGKNTDARGKADFSVCDESVRSVVEELCREYNRIGQLLNRIGEVKRSMEGSLRVLETFLRIEEIRVERHQKAILSMKEALDHIRKEYTTTEDRIRNYGLNISISG